MSMIITDNNKCLDALALVLSNRYNDTYYSIGGYQEATACIQPKGDGWIVYFGERGNRYNEERYDDAVNACVAFLSLITHNQNLITEMKEEFFSLISEKSAEDIYAELAESRACYERGEYDDFDVALDDISAKLSL